MNLDGHLAGPTHLAEGRRRGERGEERRGRCVATRKKREEKDGRKENVIKNEYKK